jgi:hypothetical protein
MHSRMDIFSLPEHEQHPVISSPARVLLFSSIPLASHYQILGKNKFPSTFLCQLKIHARLCGINRNDITGRNTRYILIQGQQRPAVKYLSRLTVYFRLPC